MSLLLSIIHLSRGDFDRAVGWIMVGVVVSVVKMAGYKAIYRFINCILAFFTSVTIFAVYREIRDIEEYNSGFPHLF